MAPKIKAMTKNGNQDTISSWKRCAMERILIALLIGCYFELDKRFVCKTNRTDPNERVSEQARARVKKRQQTPGVMAIRLHWKRNHHQRVSTHDNKKPRHSAAARRHTTKCLKWRDIKGLYLDKSFRLTWINLQQRTSDTKIDRMHLNQLHQHTNRRSLFFQLSRNDLKRLLNDTAEC